MQRRMEDVKSLAQLHRRHYLCVIYISLALANDSRNEKNIESAYESIKQ